METQDNPKIEKVAKKSFSWRNVWTLLLIAFLTRLTFGLIPPSHETGNSNTQNVTDKQQLWQQFTSDSDHFTILFPTPPVQKTQQEAVPQDHKILDHHLYVSVNVNNTDNTGYFIDTVQYPAEYDFNNPIPILEEIINTKVTTNSSKVSSEPMKFRGYDALSSLIQNGNKYIKSITFIASNRLYQVGVIYYGSTFNESDYNKYIISFGIK